MATVRDRFYVRTPLAVARQTANQQMFHPPTAPDCSKLGFVQSQRLVRRLLKRIRTHLNDEDLMTYIAAANRYDSIPYRRTGRSGLVLPA